MQKEIAIPSAYFITFTCYGTWLHGGKITSVDKQHNIPGTEFVLADANREASAKKRLVEAPYLLDHAQRHIVLDAIKRFVHSARGFCWLRISEQIIFTLLFTHCIT
jgi:hypothetical protein